MNFKLLCAGSESNDPFFKKTNVNNLGIIPRSKLNEFYHKIDLLVVPSQWHETFGLVVLEALANNVPVVCSDRVGAKDLVPVNSVFSSQEELLEKLRGFICSRKIRQSFFDQINQRNINIDFTKHVRKVYNEFYK